MTPAIIIADTARKHGLSPADLLSRRRKAVPAKKEATRRLAAIGYNWNQIARAMNCHRDTARWRAKH